MTATWADVLWISFLASLATAMLMRQGHCQECGCRRSKAGKGMPPEVE